MATLIALILLILASIQVASCDFPAENVTIEGYPRPKNFPDAPTVNYGVFPGTYDESGEYANCSWYGWANQNFPAKLAAECLPFIYDRKIMSLVAVNKYQILPIAYEYFYCRPDSSTLGPDPLFCYDNATQDIVCTVGCFNLSKTGLRLPPVTKPGESAGTNGTITSDGSVARIQQVPLVLSLLASAVFRLLAGAG